MEAGAGRSWRTSANLGAADIALREIIEEKMSFEMPEILALTRPTGKNRRRPQHWTRRLSQNKELYATSQGNQNQEIRSQTFQDNRNRKGAVSRGRPAPFASRQSPKRRRSLRKASVLGATDVYRILQNLPFSH